MGLPTSREEHCRIGWVHKFLREFPVLTWKLRRCPIQEVCRVCWHSVWFARQVWKLPRNLWSWNWPWWNRCHRKLLPGSSSPPNLSSGAKSRGLWMWPTQPTVLRKTGKNWGWQKKKQLWIQKLRNKRPRRNPPGASDTFSNSLHHNGQVLLKNVQSLKKRPIFWRSKVTTLTLKKWDAPLRLWTYFKQKFLKTKILVLQSKSYGLLIDRRLCKWLTWILSIRTWSWRLISELFDECRIAFAFPDSNRDPSASSSPISGSLPISGFLSAKFPLPSRPTANPEFVPRPGCSPRESRICAGLPL